jgi:hypothetical protein
MKRRRARMRRARSTAIVATTAVVVREGWELCLGVEEEVGEFERLG